MSNQNNVQNFITLHTTEDCAIEMNPAFIIYMTRGTHVATGMPCTTVHLTTNMTITIWETPEQISNLQMESLEKVMGSIMSITAKAVQQLEEDMGDY
jgi:hypothetical protein